MSTVMMPEEQEIASSTSMPADPLLATYKRAPMEFVRGEGVELIDADGKRYLDFASGIAVNDSAMVIPGSRPLSLMHSARA